jgi:hypothetical protein
MRDGADERAAKPEDGDLSVDRPARAAEKTPRWIRFALLDIEPWDEATWCKLEKLLHVRSPTLAVRAEIEHQACLYLAETLPRKGRAPQYVRTPAMKRRLRTIATEAERLRTELAFDGHDDRERWEGTYARGRLAEYAPLLRLDALPQILEALAGGAHAAIGVLSTRRGRPGDDAFDYLVWRLAALFEQQTGRRATVWKDRSRDNYSGAFFDFMCAVVAPLPVVKTEDTLGEAVRRALSRRPTR